VRIQQLETMAQCISFSIKIENNAAQTARKLRNVYAQTSSQSSPFLAFGILCIAPRRAPFKYTTKRLE
jgi:hypothetical protein